MISDRDAVRVALDVAGLDVPDAEIERLEGMYRALRDHARALDTVDVDDDEPAVIFRAVGR
jgi:hypothetical protein